MTLKKKGLIVFLLLISGSLTMPVFGQILVTLNVNQPITLAAAAGTDQIICPGDSADLGGSPAALNGTAPYTYAWTPSIGVADPFAGNTAAGPQFTTSYVLSITDGNGCSALDTVMVTVDTCVNINGSGWNPAISLFPNPSQGHFSLVVPVLGAQDVLEVEVFNMEGKSIFKSNPVQSNGRFETDIDISQHGIGTYLVTLRGLNGTVTRKMVVQ